MISPTISPPGPPGVISKDIGNVHDRRATTRVPQTVPVRPSAGDRYGGERLGVVSEEPEGQDDTEVPPCVGVDEDPNPVPSGGTQGTLPSFWMPGTSLK